MSKSKSIKAIWSEELRDPKNWAPVDTEDMTEATRRKFNRRRRALAMDAAGESTGEICRRTEMSRAEVFRLITRAFQSGLDGKPVGFAACIPGYRVRIYSRTDTSKSGTAGRLGAFLDEFPEIREKLDDWILGRKKIDRAMLRGRGMKRLWQAFMKACAERGIDTEADYPFSNRDGGREAIRRYADQLRERHFVVHARTVHGDASGRLAATAGTPSPAHRAVRPYERWQFDGHRLDTVLTVSMRDPSGDEVYLPIARVWLLVLIDERSRAIVGYSLSLASESYSMDDVLECLGNAFEPWTAKSLPSGSIAYFPGAGLPSGVIEQCAWRAFDTLKLDNAWAHHSEWIQERILRAGALEVITNTPGSPRNNSLIERFFGTFEQATLHPWPNTTGSGPSDPRRRSPEAAAKALKITFDDLQIIADVAIANYNASAHSALNGRSPLAFLQHRLENRRDVVRHVPARTIAGLGLFERDFDVTIRADPKAGHRPYVKFLYVRYTSTSIGDGLKYRGKRGRLRMNVRDIRTGRLFVDGICLGEVQCEPSWMGYRHDIKMRRAIFALVRQRKLAIDRHRPVADYIEHLATRESETPKGRSRLVKAIVDTGASGSEEEATLTPMEDNRGLRAGQPGWVSLDSSSSR